VIFQGGKENKKLIGLEKKHHSDRKSASHHLPKGQPQGAKNLRRVSPTSIDGLEKKVRGRQGGGRRARWREEN